MDKGLKAAEDAVLARVVASDPGVPGVVAMITDRERTIYEGAAGLRAMDGGAAMSLDTVFALFSTTKAVTGTAILQLMEEGRLDLDAPASRYVPEIGTLQVIEGFDAQGAPLLRPPRRDITTRMLMLHTAGFGYEFLSETYLRLVEEQRQPSLFALSKAALMTPLLFDPGERWEYGTSIDWCGLIVEAITGKRLGEVMRTRIFEPLGMQDTAFAVNDAMRAKLAGVHGRGAGGAVSPLPFEPPVDPDIEMGGGGLYGTVGDYMRFIRMWLNDGQGAHGRVLRPETLQMAAKNHLGDMKIAPFKGVIPWLCNDVEFFPGQTKSWALTFMFNDEPAPTGRPAGALAWAGLANLFYWIDRAGGVGGFWATQILPFGDPMSVAGYLDFETACYANRSSRAAS